ncbi:MAG: polysaccharide lyase family 8 super-sandwich domain-containing protein [Saprospiraceae bacterium]
MKRKYQLYLILLTCCSLSLSAQSDRDMETIRNRFIEELMAPDIDEEEVSQVLQSQNEDGSWPDINYQDVSRTGFEHSIHLARTRELAHALKKEGSRWKNDRKVKAAIYHSLDFWLAHDFICDNWWWNQIGVPDHMVNIYLIMDEDLTSAQIEGIKIISDRSTLNAWGARPGGDRIKIAAIYGKFGLFRRNKKTVDEAIGTIVEEIRFSNERGLKTDLGFHHRHDRVNNTLSYGTSYANSFADWANKVRGTRYHFPDKALHLLIDFYLDGICQSMVYGKYPDPGAKNRSISRKNTLHAWTSEIPRKLRQVSDYRSDELDAIIGIREGTIEPRLSGNRFYWHSEYFSHQRPHFFTSARMHSRRNHTMEEPYNEEGLQNHHLGDGSNFISRTGREYYNIFPAFDWQKIPGTTVVQKPNLPPPSEIQQRGHSDFVGAVTDGTFGAAAFDFISPLDHLQAKKAWFMFDREYVCLGTGIASKSAYPVATTINQALLKTAVLIKSENAVMEVPRGEHLLQAVEWLLQDSIGYLFHQPTATHLNNTSVIGNWRSINHQSGYTEEPIQKEVFKLWFDYGTRPQSAQYAYTVLPAVDRDDLETYSTQSPINVLSNTSDLQAVFHKDLNIVQIVFYTHGDIELPNGMQLGLSSPGIVMVYLTDQGIQSLWVSDPSHKMTSLQLSIAHAGTNDSAAKKSQSITADLPLGEYAGKSIQVKL